jgi:hypothetical protein
MLLEWEVDKVGSGLCPVTGINFSGVKCSCSTTTWLVSNILNVYSTYPLTKGEGLGMSENRVLRRIFGRKRVDVAGGWRRLHNEPEGKTPLVRARQR